MESLESAFQGWRRFSPVGLFSDNYCDASLWRIKHTERFLNKECQLHCPKGCLALFLCGPRRAYWGADLPTWTADFITERRPRMKLIVNAAGSVQNREFSGSGAIVPPRSYTIAVPKPNIGYSGSSFLINRKLINH